MSNLNVKYETMQVLEENVGEFLFNHSVGKDFLRMEIYLMYNIV